MKTTWPLPDALDLPIPLRRYACSTCAGHGGTSYPSIQRSEPAEWVDCPACGGSGLSEEERRRIEQERAPEGNEAQALTSLRDALREIRDVLAGELDSAMTQAHRGDLVAAYRLGLVEDLVRDVWPCVVGPQAAGDA